MFVVCGACSDTSDAELERRIIARVSEPVAAGTQAIGALSICLAKPCNPSRRRKT